jgi:hypothetical protein
MGRLNFPPCGIVGGIEGKGAALRILAMNLDRATPTDRLMRETSVLKTAGEAI